MKHIGALFLRVYQPCLFCFVLFLILNLFWICTWLSRPVWLARESWDPLDSDILGLRLKENVIMSSGFLWRFWITNSVKKHIIEKLSTQLEFLPLSRWLECHHLPKGLPDLGHWGEQSLLSSHVRTVPGDRLCKLKGFMLTTLVAPVVHCLIV